MAVTMMSASTSSPLSEQLATRMLTEAGFEVVSVSDVPEDPMDSVYLCRKR